jgi:hypothetical protein
LVGNSLVAISPRTGDRLPSALTAEHLIAATDLSLAICATDLPKHLCDDVYVTKSAAPKKSDANFPHSAEALARAFASLDYEVDSFILDGLAIQANEIGQWHNEVLEAFLVHARVLVNFLGGGGPTMASDITPGNFGVDWSWPTTPDALEVERQYELINKNLAHLTWERTETEESQWIPWKLIYQLVPILRQFIEAWKIPHKQLAGAVERKLNLRLGTMPSLHGAQPFVAATTLPLVPVVVANPSPNAVTK